MAKVILPYTCKNTLAEHIRKKQALKTLETGGNVTIGDIEQDLAAYVGISPVGIRQIKEHRNLPSLPLAFKIAEYFKTDVSKIFFLIEE